MPFDFMACKLKGGNGTLIWTSLIVSVVFSCEVTIASPSISNMCSISVFELLCVLRSAFRMLRAVRILFPNPTHVICFGWVSDPYYSISSVCLQILWYLIMIHLLEGFSKLLDSRNEVGAIVGSHHAKKESVSKEYAVSMWIAQLHKQVNITPYLLNSFL